MSFNEQFDQHGVWRREFALRLKRLSEWLKEQGLLNAAVEDRMLRLQARVRSDKVMVAFVAEFSRGKSELINALFFAGYGRRIMPASAGRTTMCPTELGYDPDMAPCLRLLPIETRLQPQALVEWRLVPEKWLQIDLQVDNPAQLADALQKVAEVQHVSLAQARALGFWNDDSPEDHPPVTADGRVEVPKWRHAVINIAHPLLKQGLVILDTPGLNAIGAEPELTVSLIPQAHAVVFILAADTGVTRSDLSIWQEHLVSSAKGSDNRLVVLNKIDTLWDALSTPEQVQAQIDRQIANSAEILGLQRSQVLAVSAQKGLVAKVTHDDALLQASQLPALEAALAKGLMGQRQKILRTAVAASLQELNTEASRALHMRRRDQAEQMLELRGLRGKNSMVIQQMRKRIEHEQAEFSGSSARLHAVRSVHNTLLGDVVGLMGMPTLKAELAGLTTALKQPGIKLRLKKIYGETFLRLRETLHQAQTIMSEIQEMLDSAFRQINAEFGFSLQAGRAPEMAQYAQDLELIERSHLQYLSLGNVMRLAQAGFSERLVRALNSRLRMVFESALGEVELWNQSASAQLDAQIRERRHGFSRRIEAIERIEQAASTLDERIAELDAQDIRLQALKTTLGDLTSELLDVQPLPFALQPPPDQEIDAADTPLTVLA
ncbi:dynamin family protein [Polaromonas sp.]|uniref:dynamin family protein n=1 Tax=Polaromonas sp. TaxID=1869339 RepID=UPI0013B5CA0B|nr:dynamin family protein [Polaromonas sp.]NDP62558.1 dynamin family protein [Polaromonas sp.]